MAFLGPGFMALEKLGASKRNQKKRERGQRPKKKRKWRAKEPKALGKSAIEPWR
jgi:hypothetical protein